MYIVHYYTVHCCYLYCTWSYFNVYILWHGPCVCVFMYGQATESRWVYKYYYRWIIFQEIVGDWIPFGEYYTCDTGNMIMWYSQTCNTHHVVYSTHRLQNAVLLSPFTQRSFLLINEFTHLCRYLFKRGSVFHFFLYCVQ